MGYGKLLRSTKKGFTLMELVVVIAIVAIISSVLMVNYTGTKDSVLSEGAKLQSALIYEECVTYIDYNHINTFTDEIHKDLSKQIERDLDVDILNTEYSSKILKVNYKYKGISYRIEIDTIKLSFKLFSGGEYVYGTR